MVYLDVRLNYAFSNLSCWTRSNLAQYMWIRNNINSIDLTEERFRTLLLRVGIQLYVDLSCCWAFVITVTLCWYSAVLLLHNSRRNSDMNCLVDIHFLEIHCTSKPSLFQHINRSPIFNKMVYHRRWSTYRLFGF